jgi:glycerol-3-phosphate acyltransferase PlsY
MSIVLLIVGSYILGSVPTGYWLVKMLKGIDLRKVGSGSTGATNVLRTAGARLAAVVFVIDILKGFLPVYITKSLVTGNAFPELSAVTWLLPWLPPLAGIAAVIGHSKSIFLRFQGGKSAATGCGTLIGCHYLAGFSALAFWGVVLLATKIVSVASLAAAIACAVFMWIFAASTPMFHLSFTIYAAVGGLYVIARHKANIQRLLTGTEPRIGQKLSD